MSRCDQRRLAEQRLPIGSSFAGDEPVGADERGVESEQIGDDFGAGSKLAASKEQCETEAAGGAGSGQILRASSDRRFRQFRKVLEARIDRRNRFRAHTFLRSEDRGRAALAAERIVDVGEDRDARSREPRIEGARVDA